MSAAPFVSTLIHAINQLRGGRRTAAARARRRRPARGQARHALCLCQPRLAALGGGAGQSRAALPRRRCRTVSHHPRRRARARGARSGDRFGDLSDRGRPLLLSRSRRPASRRHRDAGGGRRSSLGRDPVRASIHRPSARWRGEGAGWGQARAPVVRALAPETLGIDRARSGQAGDARRRGSCRARPAAGRNYPDRAHDPGRTGRRHRQYRESIPNPAAIRCIGGSLLPGVWTRRGPI